MGERQGQRQHEMRYYLSKNPELRFSAGARRARVQSRVLGAMHARSVGSPSNLLLDVGGSAAVAKLATRIGNTALWCAAKWKCCSHSHVNGATLAERYIVRRLYQSKTTPIHGAPLTTNTKTETTL